MPRIRTLKPEHRQHRKVGPFSDRVYRLWVSMILEADDAGRFVCDAAQLRAVTWPYHPRVSLGQVEAAIHAVAVSGMIRLYTVAEVQYAEFVSWQDHQRISHAYPSKLPEYQPSGTFQNVPEHSRGNRSGSGREKKRMEVEGKGERTGSLLAQQEIDARPANPTHPDFLDVVNRMKVNHPKLADPSGEDRTDP